MVAAGAGLWRLLQFCKVVLCAAAGLAAATVGKTAVAADAENGERLFKKDCLVCHAVEPGYHKEGPSLFGAFGRKAGSAPLYARYRGLKGASIVWDEQTLDGWLTDPRAFLGGRDTAMTIKVPAAGERADLIAYLRMLR